MSHLDAGTEEAELRRLLRHMDFDALDKAACRGMDPEVYHPDVGSPDPLALAVCRTCPARLPCLAVALRAEDPDRRYGWFGGLGPTERRALVKKLKLGDRRRLGGDVGAARARRLFEAGWVINDIADELGCSRRTIQRWLRKVA